MACKCARRTDEFHGWSCEVSGGGRAFLVPDSELCAAVYGEGPDTERVEQSDESVKKLLEEKPSRQFNIWTLLVWRRRLPPGSCCSTLCGTSSTRLPTSWSF